MKIFNHPYTYIYENLIGVQRIIKEEFYMMDKRDMRYLAYLSDVNTSITSVLAQKKVQERSEESANILVDYLTALQSNLQSFMWQENQVKRSTMTLDDSQDLALDNMINMLRVDGITNEEMKKAQQQAEKNMRLGNGVDFHLPAVERFNTLFNYSSEPSFMNYGSTFYAPAVDEQGFQYEQPQPMYREEIYRSPRGRHIDEEDQTYQASELFECDTDDGSITAHGSYPFNNLF